MRIDKPIGNESHLTGSFTGSFFGTFDGEHIGLSESIDQIYETIGRVSESLDNRITQESASIDESIHSVSASILDTVYDLSGSFDEDRTILSRSFDETITSLDNEVHRTIRTLSQSFDEDRTILSRSFDETIKNLDQDLQGQIDDTRATYTTTESLNQYKVFVDETYYKSGSQATLDELLVNNNAVVKKDVLIMGNLKVEGSSSVIHTEEVTIADHFVEIASGAISASEVDGAGFGIQGADVTMSYHFTNEGGFMELNKPLVAVSFTGSLQGNVTGDLEGNVTGNLVGTASNATTSSYALTSSYAEHTSMADTASYAHTASYASEIWGDGLIAHAIKRLENVARVKTTDSDRGMSPATFVLSCGAHKDYQHCAVNMASVTLATPDRIIPGVEHFLVIVNSGSQACTVTGTENIEIPVDFPAVPVGQKLSLTYFTSGDNNVLVTSAQRLRG